MEKIDSKYSKSFFVFFTLIVFFMLLKTGDLLPYYMSWDMDHIVVLDNISVLSGWYPDLLSHPDLGMNMVLSFWTKIARFFHFVTLSNFSDLTNSLNPILLVSELANVIKTSALVSVFSIGIFLSFFLFVLLELEFYFVIIFLGIFASQLSTTYHSWRVLAENYSIMFISLSLVFLVLGLKKRGYKNILLLTFSGIFAGLGFNTKIQSLFHLGLLCLPFLFLIDWQDNSNNVNSDFKKYKVLSIINLFVFVLLSVFAFQKQIPSNFAVWGDPGDYNGMKTNTITPVYALFSLFFVAQAIFWFVVNKFKFSCINKLKIVAFNVNLLTLGFLLSFALSFVVYKKFQFSFDYIVYSFKSMFFKGTWYNYGYSQNNYLLGKMGVISSLYVFILCLIISYLIMAYKKIINFKYTDCIAVILLSLLAFMSAAYGTRAILQDLIWMESLASILLCSLIGIIYKRQNLNSAKFFKMIVPVVGIVFIGLNVLNIKTMYNQINRSYYKSENIFLGVYSGNHLKFDSLMKLFYISDQMKELSTKQALSLPLLRQDVDFIFQNKNKVNLKFIGCFDKGFPLWVDSSNFKLADVPIGLKGAALVDISSIGFYKKHLENNLIVDIKKDLNIYVFAESAIMTELFKEKNTESIIASSGIEQVNLLGFELKDRISIPIKQIQNKKIIVVVKPKYYL